MQIQTFEAPADPSHPGFATEANKKAKQKAVLENATVLDFFPVHNIYCNIAKTALREMKKS